MAYCKDIRSKTYAYQAASAAKSGDMPMAGLSQGPEGMGNYWGGLINFTLEGGAKVTTVLDVCLDNRQRAFHPLLSNALTQEEKSVDDDNPLKHSGEVVGAERLELPTPSV